MKRRIIAWTLAVMMAVSTMPVEIVAAGELENLPLQESVAEEVEAQEEEVTLPVVETISEIEELPAETQEKSAQTEVRTEEVAPMKNAQETPSILDSGTCGDGVNYTFYDNGELVISGSGAMEDWDSHWYDYRMQIKKVTIEEGVTAIDGGAFRYLDQLTEVSIANTVTSIGDSAFAWCSKLTSIHIPASVLTIEDFAFFNCTGMQSITVAADNPNYCSVDGVLFNKSKTELVRCPHAMTGSYAIPNTVTKIGYSAFGDCDALTEVTIPDSVTEIDVLAFSGCNGIKALVLPDSVRTIGESAFVGCDGITNFVIPDGVTEIAEWTFSGCIHLNSVIIPNSVSKIGESSFYMCRQLQSVRIPGSVKEIGTYAFYDCGNLASVTLENGVERIDEGAFSWSGIRQITIPASVTEIGAEAFEGCNNLLSITVDENNPDYSSDGAALYNKDKTTLIIAGKKSGLIQNYRLIIPDGVTEIGENAFYGNQDIYWVTIPEGVVSIGRSAFDNCQNLRSLEIPDSVTSIGEYAFTNCTRLERVTIPGSVEVIPDRAFYRCSNLMAVTLNEGVKEIGPWAFANCTRLDTIVIPSSLEKICEYAFYNSSYDSEYNFYHLKIGYLGTEEQFENIVIEPGNKAFIDAMDSGDLYMASGACGANITYELHSDGELVISGEGEMWFHHWVALRDRIYRVTISDGVTGICNYAFDGCRNLEYVDLPDSVERIGDGAFENCSSLTEIALPEKLTGMGTYAFSGCSSLTTAVIPEGVEEISEYMFANCSSLRSIYLPSTLTDIWSNAFLKCNNLEYIYYAGSYPEWNSISRGKNNECLEMAGLYIGVDADDMVSIRVADCEHGTVKTESIGMRGENVRVTVAPEAGYQLASLTADYGAVDEDVVTIYVLGDFDTVTLTATFEEVRPGKTAVFGEREDDNTYMTLYDDGEMVFYQNYGHAVNGAVVSAKTDWYFSDDIKKVTVEGGLTYIRDQMFRWCSNLEEVNLANCVTSIDEYAFSGDWNLKQISLPNSVTYIGYAAFQSTGLREISLPNSVTAIAYRAFSSCDELKTITIPGNVERIEDDTFAWCRSLQRVNLPNSVTTIAYGAFAACNALEEITMPENVSSIATSAFNDCTSLRKVTFTGDAPEFSGYWSPYGRDFGQNGIIAIYPHDNPTWTEEVISDFNVPWTFVSDETEAVTELDLGRGLTAKLDMEGTLTVSGHGKITRSLYNGYNEYTMINGMNFVSNSITPKIKKLVIEEGVTGIGGEAFRECYNLTSVELPSTLAYIDGWAFEFCNSLTGIDIPGNVQYIGDCAFNWCENLETVALHEGLREIFSDAFADCYNLQSVTLPDSLIGIYSEAFAGCSSLTEITIPANVNYIGEGVFDWCGNLHTITFEGDAPENLDANAFYGVTATAYYPKNNATWNSAAHNSYGGNITWESYSAFCRHTYAQDWTYDANGHWHACTKCGGADQVTAHTYVTQIINPTLTEQGYTIYTCSVCGYSYCGDYVGGSGSGNGTIRLVDSLACAGDTITVKVNLEENPGINTFTLGFDYDESLLTLVSMEGVEELEEIGDYAFGTKAVWFSNSDTIYTGRILTATFKVAEGVDPEDVSLTVTYSPGDISNFNEDDINPVVVPGIVSVVEYKAGDINGDGTLNGKDLTRMSKFLAGYDDPALESALDVTGDGVVNAMDLIRLMKYLSGQTVVIQ